jgi:hypothetical protein
MSSFCQVSKQDIWISVTDTDGNTIRLSDNEAPHLIGDLLRVLGAPIPPELTSLTVAAPDADIDALLSLGKEWIKEPTRRRPGAHRIYFEPLYGWYGVQTAGHQATFRGQPCPLLDVLAIINRLRDAKIYYNVSSGKFCGERINEEDFRFIVEQIRTLERGLLDDPTRT